MSLAPSAATAVPPAPRAPNPAPRTPFLARLRRAAENPIFVREARDAMRAEAKGDAWHLRLLIPAALAAAVAYAALAAGTLPSASPGIAFYVLALFQSVFVLRPHDAANAISRERQANTFDPLFLTPLTPGRYLRGQLAYQCVLTVRRMALVWPFFGALYLLGGFAPGPFLAYQAMLVGYAAASAAVLMAMANALPAAGAGGGPGSAQAGSGGGAPGAAGGGGATSAGRRLAGRRTNPAANLNPLALLFYCAIPLLAMGGNLVTQRNWRIIPLLGTVEAPPAFDWVKGLAPLHPFLALLMGGDVLAFGRPIPLWAACFAAWAFAAQAAYFTFVHQLTLRRFRAARGYRGSRWALGAGAAAGLAALLWRTPTAGALVTAALASIYALVRFAAPGTLPGPEADRYQVLPRRDLFVHRAGNMLPFLPAVLAPAWAAQAAFAWHAQRPGLARLLAYLNAEALLWVGALLASGLIWRMRAERRRLVADAAPPAAPAQAPAPDAKPAAAPGNPAVAVAFGVIVVPPPILALEPLLRDTVAGPAMGLASRAVEPLLLLNPFRFGYQLLEQHGSALRLGLPLSAAAPRALPTLLPHGSRPDFYQVSLAAAAVGVALLLLAYLRAARRLERTRRDLAPNS